MLVFIDDSGDPGFEIGRGSTRYFVVVLIIFDDELEAEKAAVAIKQLRRTLRFPDDVEFKFNKSSRRVREQFLRTAAQYDFKIRCAVIDKEAISRREFHESKQSFYSYAIQQTINHSPTILDANIKIDGGGDRVFRKQFLSSLRKQLNTEQRRVIKRCRLVDSRGNVLIQLADMIAGAIRRSYDPTKTDAGIYIALVAAQIEDEWRLQ